MPKCQNCSHQWSWWDTAKISVVNNRKCSNCGERQYIVPRTQSQVYFLYFIPFIFLVFSKPLFGLETIVYISLGLIFLTGLLIYLPRTIKLSNEQKPLW